MSITPSRTDGLLVRQEGRIAVLTLNRPERRAGDNRPRQLFALRHFVGHPPALLHAPSSARWVARRASG